jgi:6,7-dimethyl-8-ribityllumazine synthase
MSPVSANAIEGELRPVPGARYAILASRWNPRITDVRVEGARRALLSHGVAEAQLDLIRVPGALELPLAAQSLARGGRHVALIALGCVVRGETRHYEHVADECARGLMDVSLEHALPVANGVLAVEKFADAEARAGGAHGNKGEEAALAALEMASLLGKLAPAAAAKMAGAR